MNGFAGDKNREFIKESSQETALLWSPDKKRQAESGDLPDAGGLEPVGSLIPNSDKFPHPTSKNAPNNSHIHPPSHHPLPDPGRAGAYT
jgi:hypothetical protein